MPIDRLLTHVLRQYQDVHDDARTEQIWSTTTTLLAQLSNPLNLSVLTSQLLTAPAIWHPRPGGSKISSSSSSSSSSAMRTCYRVISVYNTAAVLVRRREAENSRKNKNNSTNGRNFFSPRPNNLSCDAWAKAVAQGADDRSGRWQHLLVLAGVLMGMTNRNMGGEGEKAGDDKTLSRSMRHTIEQAVVTAAGLALQDAHVDGPGAPGAGAVVLALNYVFPLLSESSRSQLNYDLILATATPIVLGSEDGLHDGLFLGAVNRDVQQVGDKLDWSEKSLSFLHLRQLEQKPLVFGLGPLSRLLAHAVKNARNSEAVLQVQDNLLAFTEKLFRQWQAGRLSGMEISEEAASLTPRTMQVTWPVLWQFFKKIMYATVAVLQSVVARSLLDPRLRRDAVAPTIATKTLHILRDLYFISSQHGSSAFQVYAFTYFTAIDTMVRYPDACIALLQSIKPTPTPTPPLPSLPNTLNPIPTNPLHLTLDLFYLNLAEHLPLVLPPHANESLIIQPAATYIHHPPLQLPLPPRLVELFEAAHSATLSALACPHNAPLTARLAPAYADRLLASFPALVSPRQFRLAFRSLIQAVSPPFPLAASHPDLAETLLEMVHYRAVAGTEQTGVGTFPLAPLRPEREETGGAEAEAGEELVSEQSTLVLTLIDALPLLRLDALEAWMAAAASATHAIADLALRDVATRRFWEVLGSGEMDVERAAVGVGWWGTKGGRELLLYNYYGPQQQQQQEREKERVTAGETMMMSGAIVEDGRVGSRL